MFDQYIRPCVLVFSLFARRVVPYDVGPAVICSVVVAIPYVADQMYEITYNQLQCV
jgi:hypothetical protein